MEFVHRCPVVFGKAGADVRHIGRWRLVADVDVVGPLDQGEVSLLVDELEVIADMFDQPCLGEKVMTLHRIEKVAHLGVGSDERALDVG